jgi:hypothetical protein
MNTIEHKLTPLAEAISNPSGWDSSANYAGKTDWDGWYCVLGWNRDSGLIDECNKDEALKRLGGEREGAVEVVRIGHWACGWCEYLAVHESDQNAMQEAESIREDVDNYPILNEDDFSNKEYEAAQDTWKDLLSIKERVELCQKAGVNIFAARHDWIPQDDCGIIFDECRPQ